MNPFQRAHYRYSLALAAVLALTTAVLLVVLDSDAETAERRGEPVGGGDLAPNEVGSFDAPVNVAFAPGEPANAYVVELGGTVRVLVGGTERPEPFLDLTRLTRDTGEQGLLGLAFHPRYQANRLVYAYFTHRGTGDIVVAEFRAADPLDADETSRRVVLRIRHRMASNHNGGQLLFGPDGHLYMGTGDGGGAGDPRENAQSKASLLGKLLRINPVQRGRRAYTTPKSNPFRGRKGRPEIYARGLRNPFRFSFDSRNGRIAIGDVGQSRFEEVDYETRRSLRGANFGWDRWEGLRRYRDAGDDVAATPKRRHHDKPIHVYGRGGGCSITGGVVVRGGPLPALRGRYLYADFCQGRLRSLIPRLGGAEDDRPLGVSVPQPTSFTADPATGEIYVTSLAGGVHTLAPAP